MPIKVIVVDDEILGRKIICEFLAAHPDIQIMAECKNAHEAFQAVDRFKPELIFLDIQMPEINGFEFLAALDEKPQVIFSTAYDQYAIKAFEVNAIDYLLKPFDQERFDTALERAKNNLRNQQEATAKLEKLLEELPQEQRYKERFLIKQSGRIVILNCREIMYIESMEDYANIHTSRQTYLIQQTLTHLEKKLNPEQFTRVHRSFIVNIEYVKEIDSSSSGRHSIFLKDGTGIVVSRSGMKRLKAFIL